MALMDGVFAESGQWEGEQSSDSRLGRTVHDNRHGC